MTVSKRMADGMMLDLKSLVLVLWESAEFLKNGGESEKDKAKRRLELIKKDIRGLEEDYGSFIIGLEQHYHFNSDEINAIRLSNFNQYIKEIEEGKLESSIVSLKNLNSKLDEKLGEYFSERLFRGACL